VLAHLGSEGKRCSGLEDPNPAEEAEEQEGDEEGEDEEGVGVGVWFVGVGWAFAFRERETRMMPMAARRATSWDCGDERSASRTRCVRTLTAAGRASAAMRRARAW